MGLYQQPAKLNDKLPDAEGITHEEKEFLSDTDQSPTDNGYEKHTPKGDSSGKEGLL